MSWLNQNWYRLVVIAVALMALGDHPYGFYQLVKWVVSITSLYLAYMAYKQHRTGWAWIFSIVGILFNPIVPFYLEKETWVVNDFGVAVVYLVSLFKFKIVPSTA